MNNKRVWLIRFKASMDERSPLNMDDSEFMFAIGVVVEEELAPAISRLSLYLREQLLELVDVMGCQIFSSENFIDQSEESKEILQAAEEVVHTAAGVTWACGISSECMDFEGNEHD